MEFPAPVSCFQGIQKFRQIEKIVGAEQDFALGYDEEGIRRKEACPCGGNGSPLAFGVMIVEIGPAPTDAFRKPFKLPTAQRVKGMRNPENRTHPVVTGCSLGFS